MRKLIERLEEISGDKVFLHNWRPLSSKQWLLYDPENAAEKAAADKAAVDLNKAMKFAFQKINGLVDLDPKTGKTKLFDFGMDIFNMAAHKHKLVGAEDTAVGDLARKYMNDFIREIKK